MNYVEKIRNYLDEGILNEKYGEKKPEWAKEIEYFEVVNGALYRREISSKKSKRNEINYQLVLSVERTTRFTDGRSLSIFTHIFQSKEQLFLAKYEKRN